MLIRVTTVYIADSQYWCSGYAAIRGDRWNRTTDLQEDDPGALPTELHRYGHWVRGPPSAALTNPYHCWLGRVSSVPGGSSLTSLAHIILLPRHHRAYPAQPATR